MKGVGTLWFKPIILYRTHDSAHVIQVSVLSLFLLLFLVIKFGPRRLISRSRPTELFQPQQQGFLSGHAQSQLLGKIFQLFTPQLRLHTHKKYNKIFIIYKETQQGSGAKSYVTKYWLYHSPAEQPILYMYLIMLL